MGGWVKGLVYGTHITGAKTSLYVDGKTYINQPLNQLNETTDGKYVPTYGTTSMTADIVMRGKAKMVNGAATILFDESYAKLLSDKGNITVTISPLGESKGVFISNQNPKGFSVRENAGGTSNVELAWIAVATKAGYDQIVHPSEILSREYETMVNGVMVNDNDKDAKGNSMWWNGKDVKYNDPKMLEYRSKMVQEHLKNTPSTERPKPIKK
jgi:hypothetical protein